jgi:hypothetical protein
MEAVTCGLDNKARLGGSAEPPSHEQIVWYITSHIIYIWYPPKPSFLLLFCYLQYFFEYIYACIYIYMCKQVTYDIAYHPLPVIQIQVGETMGRKSGALRLVGRPPEVNLYNLKEPGIAWEPGAGPNILKRHSHGPMEPWDGEIAAGERGGLYVPGWEGWQRRPSLSVRRSLGPSEVWGDGEINQQNLWIVGVLRTIFTLQFVDMTDLGQNVKGGPPKM